MSKRIDEQTRDLIARGELPTSETLEEIELAFLRLRWNTTERMAAVIRALVEQGPAPRGLPIPEEERVASFADVGRLTVFVDRMRETVGWLLDDLHAIGLYTRYDLAEFADVLGLTSERADESDRRFKRFYGLTIDTLREA